MSQLSRSALDPSAEGFALAPGDVGQPTWAKTLGMLCSRLLLFALWQTVIAEFYVAGKSQQPWDASVSWWPIVALLASCTSFILLNIVYRQEHTSLLRDVLAFQRRYVKQDLLALLGLLVLVAPIGYLPAPLVSSVLFGDPEAAAQMMLRPLPVWAAYAALLFPIAIGLSELPTYFAYVMPRLEALTGRWWVGWLVASVFLGAQHMTLPLIFDWRFLVWRLLMFLPFALVLGAALRWRGRLLPYLMVVHALLDLSLAVIVLQSSI